MKKILLTLFFCLTFAAAVRAEPITVSSFSVPDWQAGGSTAVLRVYASTSFVASDGTFVIGGAVGSTNVYQKINCMVVSQTVSCPQTVIQSTTDGATLNSSRYNVVIYDSRGVLRVRLLTDAYLPATAASATSWSAMAALNVTAPGALPATYLTSDETAILINQQIGAIAQPDASDTVKGRAMLSVPPAVSTAPVAVGANDARVTSRVYADSFASLSQAIDAYPTAPTTIVVSTPEAIGTKTVPGNIALEFRNAGKLTVATGQTITCNGCAIVAPANRKIFELTGTGKVDLKNSVSRNAIHPEWWGARGQDSADDGAAIIAAYKSLGEASEQRGGKIIFADYGYKFASQLNFDLAENITFTGTESQWNGGRTTLEYVGAGTQPAISLASSRGVTFEFLRITNTNAAFTGELIKLGTASGSGDALNFTMTRCALTGTMPTSGSVPRALLNLDTAIVSEIRQTHFRGGDYNIIGRETAHSINNQFYGNFFSCAKTAAVKSVGETWTMIGNGFNGCGGNPVAIVPGAANFYSQGFYFANNYFEANGGGNGSDVRTWIKMLLVGGTFTGNKFPQTGTGGKIFEFVNNSSGISISGNRFEDALASSTILHTTGIVYGVAFSGNDVAGFPTVFSGDVRYTASGNQGVADRNAQGLTVSGNLAPSNSLAAVDLGYKQSNDANTSGQIAVLDSAFGQSVTNRSLGVFAPVTGDAEVNFFTSNLRRAYVSGSRFASLVPLNVGNSAAAGTDIKRIKHGRCALVAGVCTVTEATTTAASNIFPSRQIDGGTTGASYSVTRTVGASFTLTSKKADGATETADTSTIGWYLMEP